MASGVAFSPRRATAGPPGRALTQANSRMLRPIRVGMRNSSRPPMVRSTEISVDRAHTRRLAPLAQGPGGRSLSEERSDETKGARRSGLLGEDDVREDLVVHRAGRVALDARIERQRGRRVRERNTGDELRDHLVDLF